MLLYLQILIILTAIAIISTAIHWKKVKPYLIRLGYFILLSVLAILSLVLTIPLSIVIIIYKFNSWVWAQIAQL